MFKKLLIPALALIIGVGIMAVVPDAKAKLAPPVTTQFVQVPGSDLTALVDYRPYRYRHDRYYRHNDPYRYRYPYYYNDPRWYPPPYYSPYGPYGYINPNRYNYGYVNPYRYYYGDPFRRYRPAYPVYPYAPYGW